MSKNYFDFLIRGAARPFKTGAIVPSSRHLAEAMLRFIPTNFNKPVLEVGPGTGAITRLLYPRLASPSLYTGIEINEAFVTLLKEEFSDLRIHLDSAENVLKYTRDQPPAVIVCSLPWILFPEPLKIRLLTSFRQCLQQPRSTKNPREDGPGILSTFIFSHTRWMPIGGRALERTLGAFFHPAAPPEQVWQNLPPAKVFHCLPAGTLTD